MANEHKIDIIKRENTGKKGVKQLRREGNIPGVYYSPTSPNSTAIFISQKEYQEAVKSGARIFNISVGDKRVYGKNAYIKEQKKAEQYENKCPSLKSFLKNTSGVRAHLSSDIWLKT